MKTKVLLSVSMLFLILSCTIENEAEDQNRTPINLEESFLTENFISFPDKEGRFLSKIEDEPLLTEINSNFTQETSRSRSQCAREIIRVYWNNEAEYDFDLRESIRLRFMKDYELDVALRSSPETVENDSELWIFRDRGTHPCHTQGVEAKINNQGDGHISTDDD